MRRSIPALLAGLALIVPATASAKTTHFTGTATARALQGSTLTGTVTGTLGKGAVIYTTKAGPNGTTIVKFTIFQAKGSLSGRGTVTQKPSAAGGPTGFTGTAKITSGSGAYKGATGSFTTDGTIASDGLVTIKAKGSYKTP